MSNIEKKQLRLNAFLFGTGHHVAAWRHPKTEANAYFSPEHYKNLVQIAERGKLDAVFFADLVGFESTPREVSSQGTTPLALDPLTLLSYLSAFSENIGLIATVSTSYFEPYHLARKFASLDIISGGRTGWNLVTSARDFEAQNFGLDKQKNHADRYKIAREYVDVVKGLWDSFEDDAFEYDKANARFYNPEKLHELNHKGEYYSVKGPINVPRPIQGYPVLVQAGSSVDGQELAAETAEVVFTAQPTLSGAIEFYKEIKSRLAKYGRGKDELLILPGLSPVIGKTEAEAKAKYDELQELIPDISGKAFLGLLGGFDFSKYSPDDPFPEVPITEGPKSRQKLIADMARKENLTIRQVYQRLAGARGHLVIFGTPSSIADQLQEWLEKEAADGFNIMPPLYPSGLEEFVDLVIPELQKRGLFRTEYEGKILRENLGLKRPVNQYSAKAVEKLSSF
jgi:alkanesulfonate monooxygenase